MDDSLTFSLSSSSPRAGRAGLGAAPLVVMGLAVCTGAVTLGMVAVVTG